MYDVLIIGCGVTGAAAAFELSRYRLRVGIVERENDVALGTTKANSAILHAGYDPEPGTLMARLNVRGVELARELCRKLDVPYRPCGSLVLAFSEEERPALEELYRRGQANGVPGLKLLDGAVARSPGAEPVRRGGSRPPRPLRRHLLPLGVLPCPGGDGGEKRRGAALEHRRHRAGTNQRRLDGTHHHGGL